MSLYPNVEDRRESLRILPAWEYEEQREAEERAANADNYEYHVNKACCAIRNTPVSLVTSEFIAQVLNTLGCKASEAMLPEVAESIEILADEVSA